MSKCQLSEYVFVNDIFEILTFSSRVILIFNLASIWISIFFNNISQFFLALFCNFLHYYSSFASYHHHYIFHSWYGYGMLTENFLTQLCSRPKVFPGGKCKFVTSKLPTNLSLKQCLIGWMIDSHLPSKCNLKFQRLKNMSKRKKNRT